MSQQGTARGSLRQRLADHHGQPLIIGHRGALGYRPENTMPSFEHALALGADCVEFDVHLTRDGVPVVIHDETVDRTTNGHGFVHEHTLTELQSLDAGAWFSSDYAGARVPTLEELLYWASKSGMAVDVEIKNAPIFYDGIENRVVAALRQADMTDQAIVSSFDHVAVQRVGELAPEITLGVLYGARPVDAGRALADLVGATVLLPHVSYVRPVDVAVAHEAGLAVIPWTTSDEARVCELLEARVDGICSNHPDVVRRLVAA